MMYDVLVKRARILDGAGSPWFIADVAIKDGRIAKVGTVEGDASIVVDAHGKYLSPGFIDAHSHSDLPLVVTPTADSKVMQGVTLEVIGQCGTSGAPRDMGLREAQTGEVDPDDGSEPRWTDMASYIDVLETRGVSVNVAPLIGHGTVRRQVMGVEDRAPDARELELMKGLVNDAMEQGAFGISTGLIYVPGRFSETPEVVELAKVVSRHHGIYVSHIRNEGAGVVSALEEAIQIGLEADLPVHVSHFKVMGEANWGTVKETVAMVEHAREKGLDITGDQYPYIASSTGLGSPLPASAWRGGKGSEALDDPSAKRKVLENLRTRMAWDKIVIAALAHPDDQAYIGKSIQEVAILQGIPVEEAVFGLMRRNRGVVTIVNFAMSEDDVRYVMSRPWIMVGSDGRSYNVNTAKGQPHPRSYGTFVRVLGRYVREYGVLRLEEAVRKMTSLPAMRLGLQDRGLVKEGMVADLVVFDADTVVDNATFDAPHQYPSGIEWVFVNGVTVVREGAHTGAKPGKVLRHKG